MTMQNNSDDKGLKLELDTATDLPNDDAAFDDVAIDEELDESMTTTLPQQRNSRGKAKLMAGVVLVAILGIGGFVGYKQLSGGTATTTAAIPGDVPAGQPIERVSGADGTMPAAVDGGAVPMDPMGNPMPVDPMMAGNMPPADGSMPAPMDGGMPMDPAMDPNAAGIVPPAAPGMPDAVMADGNMPPVDPMMAGQPMDANMPPMDGGMMPPPADPMADPMAAMNAPVDPAAAPMGDAMGAAPAPTADLTPVDAAAPQLDVAGIVPPPVAPVEPPPAVVETVAPAPVAAPVVPAVDPAVAQEMRSKIETLENRIAEMDRELQTLRQQQSEAKPAVANSEVTAADLKALERRIDALATKAASAAAVPAPVKAAPTPLVAPKPAPAPVATPEIRNTTMVAPATSTVRTAVGTATGEPVISPQTPRAPVAAPAPTAGKVIQWQLRSAQPGRATLSQQGSQEMRNVGVGDEVPGLGRILSIAQGADGRWVVRGSMGSAAQ